MSITRRSPVAIPATIPTRPAPALATTVDVAALCVAVSAGPAASRPASPGDSGRLPGGIAGPPPDGTCEVHVVAH